MGYDNFLLMGHMYTWEDVTYIWFQFESKTLAIKLKFYKKWTFNPTSLLYFIKTVKFLGKYR